MGPTNNRQDATGRAPPQVASAAARMLAAADALDAAASGLFGPLRAARADYLRSQADDALEAWEGPRAGDQEALPILPAPDGGPPKGGPQRPLGISRTCAAPPLAAAAKRSPADGPGGGHVDETLPVHPAAALRHDGSAALLDRLKLADGIRPWQSRWTWRCLRYRTRWLVQLQRDTQGRVAVSGVHCCGSVWTCPVCAPRIYATRQGEIHALHVRSLEHTSYMLTLTLRHSATDDPRVLFRDLARCWRRFWSGKAGTTMRRKFLRLRAYVRGFETTHGANGWHPHYHILLLVPRELPPDAERELTARWRACVAAELGTNVPNLKVGARLSRTNTVRYLCKIGLEVAGITRKVARGENRTPWQIAHAAVAGDKPAQRLWCQYRNAIRGTRQLTWSRGTKLALHIPEVSDEEAAANAIVPATTLDLPGDDWDRIVAAHLVTPMLTKCSAYGLGFAAIYVLRARERMGPAPPDRDGAIEPREEPP